MSVENQNISMYAGDYKEIICNVIGDNHQPLAMTGLTANWHLKHSSEATNKLATVPQGAIATKDGEIRVRLDSEVTANLGRGRYYYAITVTDEQGNTSHVTTGYITLK